MNSTVYYIISAALILGILAGIAMMSRVKTALWGNRISALCTGLAILLTLSYYRIISDWLLWAGMGIGFIAGLIWAYRIKMIQMPQVVALFNGFGGAASAIVAMVVLTGGQLACFTRWTAAIALIIGMVTLVGSLIAAGKLQKLISQKPVVWKNHQAITVASLALSLAAMLSLAIGVLPEGMIFPLIMAGVLLSSFFGVAFAIRVGGADMPITISLLNSLSGVAGSIAGMAVGDVLLVAVGSVVGASGLLLTQIMCRAMNRSLKDILLGKTSVAKGQAPAAVSVPKEEEAKPEEAEPEEAEKFDPAVVLKQAKDVIIVPGYGMALAQAQSLVKQLADRLEGYGCTVRYAIHPVAGRMPGHMNVLLAEVDVPYDQLYEMDSINDDFAKCDAAVIIGANDVVNPAAGFAEGTPIYGMPVLKAAEAPKVIVCNFDLKPGYAGVENPLYSKRKGVALLLGDAKETLAELLKNL